ncbi:MAG: Uncharacterised protein [Flavobacteriia bacterium]|nr:MAG: Uncharacterised protein [Flavobacteriia bacterium]
MVQISARFVRRLLGFQSLGQGHGQHASIAQAQIHILLSIQTVEKHLIGTHLLIGNPAPCGTFHVFYSHQGIRDQRIPVIEEIKLTQHVRGKLWQLGQSVHRQITAVVFLASIQYGLQFLFVQIHIGHGQRISHATELNGPGRVGRGGVVVQKDQIIQFDHLILIRGKGFDLDQLIF